MLYTAAVLTPQSVNLLRWVMRAVTKGFELERDFEFKTPQHEPIPHHMTINLGKLNTELNPDWILGMDAKLKVDQLRWSEEIGACAFRVVEAISIVDDHIIKSFNDKESSKHITTCLKHGIKAYKSNDLFGPKAQNNLGSSIQYSNLFQEIIELDAVIKECS